MPSKPGAIRIATWQLGVPNFLSDEQITTPFDEGYLGVDYDENTDSRFHPYCTLGPKITTLDLSTHDGANVPQNTVGFALSHGMNATKFIYVGRGIPVAKVKASDLTLVNPGTVIALSANATGLLYTKNAAAVEMISIFQGDSNAFLNITTVANAGSADTSSANDETQAATVGAQIGGSSDDPRIGIMKGQTFRQNVITTGTTMDASTFVTRAVIPEAVTPTGIAMDGSYVILGTDLGPYYLDNEFLEYQALIPEIRNSPDTNNCKNMRSWNVAGIGVLCPLDNGLRFIKNLGGWSIGPEVYRENKSAVQGRVTAIAATNRFAYLAVYNPDDDLTYIVAMRPRELGAWHQYDMSYWVLAKLAAGVECGAMEFIGKYGGATADRIIGGYDSNMFSFIVGEIARETDDAAYAFALTGTSYLTELRRFPGLDKQVEWFEFETEDCTSTETVTLQVQVDGETAMTVGAAVTSNGFHRIKPTEGNPIRGIRIKPQFDLVSGASTTAPKVKGPLRMYYRLVERAYDGEVLSQYP